MSDSGHPYAFQGALLGPLGAVYALYDAVVDGGTALHLLISTLSFIGNFDHEPHV